MADNKKLRGARDRDRVSGSEQYEVRYLTEKYNVSRDIVMEAIQSCGNSRSQVEKYLKERTGRGRGDLTQNGPA
jgi:hypothetical protein